MEGEVGVRPAPGSAPSVISDVDRPPEPEVQANRPDDDGDNCRICRGEGTTVQPLFYPCKCSGSIRFVHQECLMEWLAHSQKKYCELCKTPFTFTKLYDHSMPSTLPMTLFLRQLVYHAVASLLRNIRYVVVTLVWLCWLPWSIRQVWRGLFWLADGSWVTKARLQEAALSELTSVSKNSIISTLSNMNHTLLNATELNPSQVQFQTSLFSGFVGLFTGDFILVEVAKLIFPSLSQWSHYLISSDAADDPVILLTMDRQPSLLSNVGFVKSLTKYQFLHGAIIDVLEGQLICVFIVVAFILVFLIREWVINQQPIANMPDPDAVEAAAPGNAQDDAARAARRRRRALRRRAGEDQRAEDPPLPGPQLQGARVIAPLPHRPRQHPNGVIDVVQDNQNPQDVDQLLEESPMDTSNTDPMPQSPSEADSADWVDEDEAVDARPPLPARGAFDDMTSIQRGIEEGDYEDIDTSPLLEGLPTLPKNPAGRSLQETHQADDPHFTMKSDQGEDTAVDGQDHPDSPQMSDLMQSLHEAEILDTSSMEAEASETEAEKIDQFEAGEDMLGGTAVAEDYIEYANTSDGESADSVEANTPGTPTEEFDVIPVDLPEARILPERSALEKLFDWFWHFDEDTQGQLVIPQIEIRLEDELVLEDAAAGAPFVPLHGEEPEPAAFPAVDPLPPAPAQEPNMLFGVDVNNPDAMEDAEDLDGILELVGMQGPLAGMIQNVIFSEFLISLTIAASIWLPYIWGKIALLILANPVGVFIKAPLFLCSAFADVVLDLAIFVLGLLALAVVSSIKVFLGFAGQRFQEWQIPAFVNTMSSNITRASGTRLEDTLSKAYFGLRPDLPSFSLRSHHALRVIEAQAQSCWARSLLSVTNWFDYSLQYKDTVSGSASGHQEILQYLVNALVNVPHHLAALVFSFLSHIREFLATLHNPSPIQSQKFDIGLARWNTQDKVLAIILGYLFFACIGYMYLQISRLVLGLRSEEKVDGVVADSLRQAGGVVKVVIIIGIEMLVFPLYCGLLLDGALMPLFEGVTLQTRLAFMLRAPLTGLFVHWFIGTCYMFHFALFVAMCREIFRKGVLYFIRDPEDPTFHPVRDVLERPALTQLSKIAFSGFIYGGLVYLCLGGVVYALSCIPGILPIRWSTNQPQFAFPIDLIFFHFLLPIILRKTMPSKKIAAMYGWWFRGCAHGLRLTNFLFGEDRPEEKGVHAHQSRWSRLLSRTPGSTALVVEGKTDPLIADSSNADDFVRDGGYVRAPASDRVRIPKGHKVFLEVDEKNERIDGEEDKPKGMHGFEDDRFMQVYIPPNFKARITTFIILLWLFAAATGVAFTIGPLLLGRWILQPLTSDGKPPNDLFAVTVGLHVAGLVIYAIAYCYRAIVWAREHTTTHRAQLYPIAKYLLGLLYLGAACCILVVVSSLLLELYIHVPLQELLISEMEPEELPEISRSPIGTFSRSTLQSLRAHESNGPHKLVLPPTIFLLQSWTVGLLLLRVLLRPALANPDTSRAARAIKAIVRRGYLHPDVGLATRALLIPATILASAAALAPLALGRMAIFMLDVTDEDDRAHIYRCSFPVVAGQVVLVFTLLALKRRVGRWRSKIRDEVYLVGERLHNYQETRESLPTLTNSRSARSERVEVG
jgi:E3 ubiquitin-protein ligase MARCH6